MPKQTQKGCTLFARMLERQACTVLRKILHSAGNTPGLAGEFQELPIKNSQRKQAERWNKEGAMLNGEWLKISLEDACSSTVGRRLPLVG